jgi:hypothetical protein
MTPATLADVAQIVSGGESFDASLANFLDRFYVCPSAEALSAEPLLLSKCQGDIGHVRDAYLAGTAEELAARFALPVPEWTASCDRALHRPWFASTLGALRAVLLVESPPAFRARNLFVSENALSRV